MRLDETLAEIVETFRGDDFEPSLAIVSVMDMAVYKSDNNQIPLSGVFTFYGRCLVEAYPDCVSGTVVFIDFTKETARTKKYSLATELSEIEKLNAKIDALKQLNDELMEENGVLKDEVEALRQPKPEASANELLDELKDRHGFKVEYKYEISRFYKDQIGAKHPCGYCLKFDCGWCFKPY